MKTKTLFAITLITIVLSAFIGSMIGIVTGLASFTYILERLPVDKIDVHIEVNETVMANQIFYLMNESGLLNKSIIEMEEVKNATKTS